MSAWLQIETSGRRIGYARVSTKDQHLRMQLDALKAVSCHPIYKDHGVSGVKARRPGLDKALKKLQPDDAIIVFRLDRLGRSVLHLADLLAQFQARNVHFCSLSEGINTATPSGKLVFHIFSAVAEFERCLISERTRFGLQAARKRGKRLGRPRLLPDHCVYEAHILISEHGVTVADMSAQLGVSRSTLTRALDRLGLEWRQ